jgi:hypothetical protein
MRRKPHKVLGRRPDRHRSDHVEAARTMRKAFQNPAPAADTAGLRDLADYDRAFGVVLDDGQVA